jgi:hypothetical protein
MGFLSSTIEIENKKYKATISTSWLLMTYNKTENFDNLDDAKEWILNERCYNNLTITDDALSKLSYVDALKLGKKKTFKTNF